MSLIGRNIEKLSISSELTRNAERSFTTGACSFGVNKLSELNFGSTFMITKLSMMPFYLKISLALMKNCVFLNIAWMTLKILSEKRGNTELPKTLTKPGSQMSSWFKENFWSVNQKIPHSDSTAVIISPLRADWPGDAEAFWSVLWGWLESASRILCFQFKQNISWKPSVCHPSPVWESFFAKINLVSPRPLFFPPSSTNPDSDTKNSVGLKI